jgi:hypothetical protein
MMRCLFWISSNCNKASRQSLGDQFFLSLLERRDRESEAFSSLEFYFFFFFFSAKP